MNMANVNGEHVNELLLQAQTHLWNHMFSFINFMSLQCAIDLGIPDIIHNHAKPMTIIELVEAIPMLNPTKSCCIYRLMRILVHTGFFAHQKLGDEGQEGGYVLTNASRLLLKGHPLNMTPFVELGMDPISAKSWHFLGAWFRNDDRTAFDTAHGQTFWEYCNHDPKINNLFNEGMARDAGLVTSVLIEKCKGVFEGLESLVDVGGGTGTLGKAIVKAFPHLECTVFDLPHVVDGLQDSDNLKYVGGDMFEEIPASGAVLLKCILHNWNDEECLMILKRCKEAVSSRGKVRGKVIIIDMVLMGNHDKVNDYEASNSTETQLQFDMLMMTFYGGKERRKEEWANLFYGAGFSDYKITPVFGLRSLIELFP